MKHKLRVETRAAKLLNAEERKRLVANICDIVYAHQPEMHCSVTDLTHIFDMGMVEYAASIYSEKLSVAIEQFLETKRTLRRSSYAEYCSVLRRLLRENPGLGDCLVRQVHARDCLNAILKVYQTAHTVDKARRLLHCFFQYALQQNWCGENPVSRLQVIRKQERVVDALTMEQVNKLLAAAEQAEHRACAPAIGLMLWAGIRPYEVARLQWKDVDMEERIVALQARHSKTGGARVVNMQPILVRWLKRMRAGAADDAMIAPHNWPARWRAARESAGLRPWHADTLRHTFASYYLKQFNDVHRLQMEMGHSNVTLLFTRYLNLRGITRKAAAAFWDLPMQENRRREAPVPDEIEN